MYAQFRPTKRRIFRESADLYTGYPVLTKHASVGGYHFTIEFQMCRGLLKYNALPTLHQSEIRQNPDSPRE